MSKKKKETRKYTPKNEFRRNTSKSAVGHFDYVFGETPTHYKSLGLTHTPDNKYPYYPLKENPNPTDSKQSFLRLNVRSTNKKYLSKKEENWKFSKEDMPVVRRTIKKYKKSTNRQPKDWYVKKKKGHKKKIDFVSNLSKQAPPSKSRKGFMPIYVFIIPYQQTKVKQK